MCILCTSLSITVVGNGNKVGGEGLGDQPTASECRLFTTPRRMTWGTSVAAQSNENCIVAEKFETNSRAPRV